MSKEWKLPSLPMTTLWSSCGNKIECSDSSDPSDSSDSSDSSD